MPFLLLLIALFIFTLVHGKQDMAFFILMMIIAAVLATYNKTFRESIREFF